MKKNMKKILILVVALAITIGATAQENPLTYGVKAGLNLSQISSGTMKAEGESQGVDALDMKAGFFVSGHVNYSFGEFFGIQPELSYSTQGGKMSEEGSTAKYSFNYINIPVLFEVKPVTNFSLFVGPQIGLNIHKGVSMGGISISGSSFTDVLKEGGMKFNNFDIAAVVGLQYAIDGKYLISARYNIGFTTTMDSDISGMSISGLANRVFQFGVGYQF